MTSYDLFLISPPLVLAVLAMLVIVVDLLTRRTGLLVGLSFVGLAAPAALSAWQALELTSSGASQLTAEGSVVLHTLSIDRFSLFFNFLILAAVGLVVLVSTDYVRRMERLQGEFFALMLLSATGMMLLVSAHELITMYIALELTTLPLAALAAFLPNGRSSEAGMKFLIIGALSSALMLYGMALIYGFTGSTQLDQIAAALSAGASAGVFPFGSMAVLLAIVLLLVGFGFKMSAAPFQMWVPDVYEGAPTPMVAFLSVASKAAAFALVLRVFYIGFEALDGDWWVLLAGLAALSMTVGNLVAIAQRNIKRMFGYSTVAHAGYILVGVAAVASAKDTETFGPSSVLFYLSAYTAANLAAFFAIVCIGNRINSDEIYDYSGMVTYGAVLRQDLRFRGGDQYRRVADDVAGDNRRGQQRGFSVLLPAGYQGDVPANPDSHRASACVLAGQRGAGCRNAGIAVAGSSANDTVGSGGAGRISAGRRVVEHENHRHRLQRPDTGGSRLGPRHRRRVESGGQQLDSAGRGR